MCRPVGCEHVCTCKLVHVCIDMLFLHICVCKCVHSCMECDVIGGLITPVHSLKLS